MSKKFLYVVRTRAIFEEVKFDYFQITTAHKIIQKFEPNVTKNAVYKSMSRASWSKFISQLHWNQRRNIEGFDDLDTNGKLRAIWQFTPDNVRHMLDWMEQDFDIKEEDYPMYAKIMLGGDDVVGHRNLILEEES